eukprot:XP_011605356.1 PREDICTED: G/T mismatch-specific thymine DNA glycosylase-like isoform X1 [Takifugu rubripes]
MYDRYQPSQEQPENQYVLSYPSTVIPRDGPVMSGHQVSDDQNHLTEAAYQYHSRNHADQNHPWESSCNHHLLEQAYQNYSTEPAYQNPVHHPSLQHHHPAQQRLPQPVAGSILPEPPPAAPPPDVTPTKKKRGRPAKCVETEQRQRTEVEASKKAKRVLNRFDGMSVDEVMARTLPDVIAPNLDILIIGINPGLLSAYKGHHYPNPGNHFWKCLFLSGFTEKQLNYSHDQSLPEIYGIGFTNMVERTTPGSKDLSNKEIREGGRQLLAKLQKYKPLIAAFNGKGIYEIFCKETFGVKAKNLDFGLQPYRIPDTETVCYLMPSSSPRCAQFPRAQDKVHFYIKLKELRDQMKGVAPRSDVQETQYSFDLQLAKEDGKRMAVKEEQEDPEYESCSGQQRLASS